MRFSLVAPLAVSLVLAASGSAAGAPPTLSGETLQDFGPAPTSQGELRLTGTCDPTGVSHLSGSFAGLAAGPYPGTFTEQILATIGPQNLGPVPDLGPLEGSQGLATGPIVDFSATFTIDSPNGTVTGTKQFSARAPLPSPFIHDPGNSGVCKDFHSEVPPFPPGTPAVTGSFRAVDASTVDYHATISAPEGNFTDRGGARASARTAYVAIDNGSPGGSRINQFVQGFASDLTATEPLLPITKDDCKKGGWQSYGVFKNQGDCVSFVATGGKNPPAGR
jgi:hypothetical protein